MTPTKEDIAKHLMFGFTDDFHYNLRKKADIDWNEAKSLVNQKISEKLNLEVAKGCSILSLHGSTSSFYYNKLISSSLPVHFVSPNLIKNLESLLFEMNTILDSPAFLFDDFYNFIRQKDLSENKSKSTKVLFEERCVFLLCNQKRLWHNIMILAIKNGEYKIDKAKSYSGKHEEEYFLEKYKRSKGKLYKCNYIKSLLNFVTSFGSLEHLHLETPSIELRHNNLEHLLSASEELGKRLITSKTKKFANHFEIDISNPTLDDEELINLFVSLPFEMKYCLSKPGYIISDLLYPDKYSSLYATFSIDIIRKILQLSKNYLSDKDSLIFNYLPFDPVQKSLTRWRIFEAWKYLNLEIWLRINS